MTSPFPRLSKAERQSRIIAELRATPSLRVNMLSERLRVSTETVRRDLAELDDAGLISRTYGGAMRSVPFEPAISVREGLMIAERESIAQAAVQLVERNDILMIGGGATTLHVARRLSVAFNDLTVITHAFSIAAAIAANPTHKVLMLPGQFEGREGLIHGPETIDALQRFHANKAFLGASGLTAEGPNDAGIGPGLTYGTMMRRAAHSIIVADHSKFEKPSLTVYGRWSAATTLVTDQRPKGKLAAALLHANTNVIEAAPEPVQKPAQKPD
ncbi:DeoR family transcriptional regulator [Acidocella aquatica]|uniref:DeoR family transcriptional regulator n=1 Tax=Acidocella aquatica TaxID=1922313 RepID=A0ABQ6A6G5_9PROT|nr:DeoR/GlpR family DNA-binding transcription regulator [Acidocella aquatica]GLR67774.1 DeoR family transcriptional regulator [Acidocella aquatica]